MTVNQINELVKFLSEEKSFSRASLERYGYVELADSIQLGEDAKDFDQTCRSVLGGVDEVGHVDFLPKHRLYGAEEVAGSLDAIREVIESGEFTSGSKSEEF